MGENQSLRPSYFDGVYAAHDDPWHFETSPYEQAKYAATLAALPRNRYARAFEIGCSIGVLTGSLAQRCDALLAVDVSEAALMSARRRLAHLPHVELQQMLVPHEFPRGEFDLVMLSEVGYYWSKRDLNRAARRIVAAMRPGASLVLVHWTEVVADYPLTGDQVHAHFLASTGDGGSLRHLTSQRECTYRLDVFERAADAAPCA